MTLDTFFEKFDLFADAPDAVAKMRELVLQLAVKGRLVEQRSSELSAMECITKANNPLVELAFDASKETPTGWLALPLGCLIATNIGGGTPSKANLDYWNGTIPWASVKDIQNDKYLVATIDSITEVGLKNSSSNLIPPGRLLVVTRMGLGKLAINKVSVAINQDLRAIEPTTALDLNFAYLLFKSLKMVGSGVTVKGITVDKLHAMQVFLPPLAEQKRIVAKVDELMALCDRLEAQQQERAQQHAALSRASLARFAEAPTPANLNLLFHSSFPIPSSDLRKSILTLAVQGKLVPQDPNDEPAEDLAERIRIEKTRSAKTGKAGKSAEFAPITDAAKPYDIPASWAWIPLGNVTLIRTGKLDANASSPDGPYPFFTCARDPLRIDRYAYDGECVLLAGNGNFDVNYYDGKFEAYQRTYIIEGVSRDMIDGRYLFRFIQKYADTLREMSVGGVISYIKIGFLTDAPLPLPPLAEQRRIVEKVEQLMALVDDLESQLAASRTTATKLLSALVAELTKS